MSNDPAERVTTIWDDEQSFHWEGDPRDIERVMNRIRERTEHAQRSLDESSGQSVRQSRSWEVG